MFVSERLRHARERVGLTSARAAVLSGIGASSLSEFENGRREPSLSQLRRLAETYRKSSAFFLEPGPPPRDIVLWRERPRADVGNIEAQFLRFCEQYYRLEIWCGDFRRAGLPEVGEDSEGFSFTDARALARTVRDRLRLGDWPGRTLKGTLEEVCGVKLFHLRIEPTGTAASTLSRSFGAGILLNSNNTRWRRNFDVAHELFHLLTWEIFHKSETSESIEADRYEEQLANCFASALLMPEEPLRLMLEKEKDEEEGIPFPALFDIARQFDVSVEALLWRIHSLFRSPDQETRTRQEIETSRELAKIFEERSSESPAEKPARFHALAVKALRRGEISVGRFAEYVGISRQKAMSYLESGEPNGKETAVALA